MDTMYRDERSCPACGQGATMAKTVMKYVIKFSSPLGVRTDYRCATCHYAVTELENVIFR